MFNPIRELIAENEITRALAACGDLELAPANRSRLISLRRRWDLLTEQAIAQTREERLLRLEENGVVDDLLKWLDQMEYAPAKEEWSVKVTHTKQGTGAAAGTGDGSVKSSAKWPWIAAAVIALMAATWMLWPDGDPTPIATRTEREAIEEPAKESPSRNESTAPPAREEPTTTSPTNPGKTKVNPSDLVVAAPGKVDLSKVDASRVQINPDIRLNSDVLRKLASANALMTTGDQVDITVAVYNAEKAPTKYNASASKSLASYLDRKITSMDVVYNVLTQKFHDHDKRDRLFSHGNIDDKSLTAKRSRFLLLADLRKNSANGTALMKLSLYDVERGKGFPKNKYSVGQYTSGQQIKELYAFADEYLKDMKEREILK